MPILRRFAIATTLFLVFGLSSISQTKAAPIDDFGFFPEEPGIVNVVDDFLAFWDHARGMSLRRQRRAFVRMVENKHKDYFERAVYRGASDAERRIMLDNLLLRVPWQVGAIREFNKTAPDIVAQGLRDFRSRFPEYSQQKEIYIAPSLFRFDGSVRPVHNELGIPDTLCLGAELLSDYTPEQFQVVIVHELFHLYHFGFLMKDASPAQFRTAHMPLMIEGMAVAGTEAIYPYQHPSLYLHFSEEEVVAQQEVLTFTSDRFLRLIGDGALPEEYEPWFTRLIDDRIPPRAGYLLGYEVTKRVLATYTIEQMVRLTPAQLREHAEEQLLAMASDEIVLLAGGN
jgi:hypothetical protein